MVLGFLVAIYSMGQFLSTPVLGQLSDVYGRKRLLLLCLCGTLSSYILLAIGILTKDIPLLFFARALDGVTGGNVSIAQASIADITPYKHKARNFALIGGAYGLGFIAGPYLGGKFSDSSLVSWFNLVTPFWIAAMLSLINILLVLFILPETLKAKAAKSITVLKAVKDIKKANQLKKIKTVFLTIFFFQSGFCYFTTFISIFLIKKFGFTQGGIGDYFSYIGIIIALSQILIIRKIENKFKARHILLTSMPLAATGIFLLLIPTSTTALILFTPFFAVFVGITQAFLTALISNSVNEALQGEVLGITASIQALAESYPPLIAGVVAAGFSTQVPILISGLMIILAAITFTRFE